MKGFLRWSLFLLICLTLNPFTIAVSPAAAVRALEPPEKTSSSDTVADAQTDTYMLYVPRVGTVSAPTVFGLEDGNFQNDKVIEATVESGASWLRRNALLWSSVEPQKGQRQWEQVSAFEAELKEMASTGKEILLIIHRTPDWARQYPNSPCGPVKESEIPALANFVSDVVKRYSEPPFNIRYYELWNEPDAFVTDADGVYGCWGDTKDTYYGGRYYASVLKQVQPKVKAANPNAQLAIGGLLLDCDPVNPPIDPGTGKPKDCKSSRYLEGILVGGGGTYFDVVSYHAYDYYYGGLGSYGNYNWHSSSDTSGPSIIAKTRYIKNLLAQYNITGKTLLCTEIALVCDSGCGEDFEQTKAYYLAQAYAASIVEGVQGSFWYSLINKWRNSGLITPKTYARLPAFEAFKFGRSELSTAKSGSDVSQGLVRIYEINAPKGRIWLMWSKDSNEHTVHLDTMPYAAFDLYGKSLAVSQNMVVTLKPIYIEWDAAAT